MSTVTVELASTRVLCVQSHHKATIRWEGFHSDVPGNECRAAVRQGWFNLRWETHGQVTVNYATDASLVVLDRVTAMDGIEQGILRAFDIHSRGSKLLPCYRPSVDA